MLLARRRRCELGTTSKMVASKCAVQGLCLIGCDQFPIAEVRAFPTASALQIVPYLKLKHAEIRSDLCYCFHVDIWWEPDAWFHLGRHS